MRGRPLVLLLLLACAGAAGCRGRANHPVVRVASDPSVRCAAEQAPEPSPPDGVLARSLLFLGLGDAEGPLRFLAARGTPPGVEPQLVQLPWMERAALRRYRRGGPTGGVVRSAVAVGFSAWLPIPPRRAADLLVDAEFEGQSLDAERFALLGVEFDVAGASRRRYRVEMLNRGEGPIRFDLRFTLLTERWDLPDGSVVLRHDPQSHPPAEHVTLYRGAVLVVPEGRGSRLTEFLVMGTDIAVPFFLYGLLRDQSINVFRIRATRIGRKAVELAR